MKYIVVPEDVTIVDRKSGKTVMRPKVDSDELESFVFRHSEFVVYNLCSHEHFGKSGGRGIRLQIVLIEKFENCKPGDLVGIESADYELIRPVIASIQWHKEFVRYLPQVLAHVEAWEKAEKQDDAWKKRYDEEQRKNPAAVSVEQLKVV